MSPMYSILFALMCDIIEAVETAFVTVSAVAAAVLSSGEIISSSPWLEISFLIWISSSKDLP